MFFPQKWSWQYHVVNSTMQSSNLLFSGKPSVGILNHVPHVVKLSTASWCTPYLTHCCSLYAISEGSSHGLIVCNLPWGMLVCTAVGSPAAMSRVIPAVERLADIIRRWSALKIQVVYRMSQCYKHIFLSWHVLYTERTMIFQPFPLHCGVKGKVIMSVPPYLQQQCCCLHHNTHTHTHTYSGCLIMCAVTSPYEDVMNELRC